MKDTALQVRADAVYVLNKIRNLRINAWSNKGRLRKNMEKMRKKYCHYKIQACLQSKINLFRHEYIRQTSDVSSGTIFCKAFFRTLERRQPFVKWFQQWDQNDKSMFRTPNQFWQYFENIEPGWGCYWPSSDITGGEIIPWCLLWKYCENVKPLKRCPNFLSQIAVHFAIILSHQILCDIYNVGFPSCCPFKSWPFSTFCIRVSVIVYSKASRRVILMRVWWEIF